jgi:hypothetical protein
LNMLVPVVRPIDRFLPFPHLSWIVVLRRDDADVEIVSVDPIERKQIEEQYPTAQNH